MMSVADVVAIVHMGRALCGHDGIIHGGLIATVFDETLARNVRLPALWPFGRPANIQALLNLPTHIGVTASLTIDYKAPTQADQVRYRYRPHGMI
jgi:acyl-coenzyme A thioesterase PaaI-like protein